MIIDPFQYEIIDAHTHPFLDAKNRMHRSLRKTGDHGRIRF